MSTRQLPRRVGELRPTQLLFSFGVASIVDLPKMSVMVMGLDDWDVNRAMEVGEKRLLGAVRDKLGPQVTSLRLPPMPEEMEYPIDPLGDASRIGVPVRTFPGWMRCPWCSLLAPVTSGLFKLKADPYRPEKTRFVHATCSASREPDVLPARFLVACERGHIDDFPWTHYAHGGPSDCKGALRLFEVGHSGEAREVMVKCDGCQSSPHSLAAAFGERAGSLLPPCSGRNPHLREREENGCRERVCAILLGASNSWFAVTYSALAIPTGSSPLEHVIDGHWVTLEKATSREVLAAFRAIGKLRAFAEYSDDEIWSAIEKRRSESEGASTPTRADLKTPEWELLTRPDPAKNSPDFRLTSVGPPVGYEKQIPNVVLVERLREVRALLGFARIVPPGDFGDVPDLPADRLGKLARRPPTWVPASEVRGEGIFIEFSAQAIEEWTGKQSVQARALQLLRGHTRWRSMRQVPIPSAGFPDIRYVLIHSFAHALMRQFSIECGYALASIRERVYAREPGTDAGPAMAGVLIYTAAPDSEGTLGGLVSLGKPKVLARHIDQALEQVRLCSSDPLCAEHDPGNETPALHGAACHSCLFGPETSCERGNKYVDRAVLVRTFSRSTASFFDLPETPR